MNDCEGNIEIIIELCLKILNRYTIIDLLNPKKI